MAFTTADIEAFIGALHSDPILRDRVRASILHDDFLALPGIVARLAEQVTELVRQVANMDTQMARVDGRMGGLDGRMEHLDGRMDGLDGRMDHLHGRMDDLDGRMDRLDGRMGRLDGRMYELDYERKLKGRIGRHFTTTPGFVHADYPPVADAYDRGLLSDSEWDDLMRIDVAALGRPRRDASAPESVILIELSLVVDTSDVVRASRRAAIVAKLGLPVIPCVDGEVINTEGDALADELGVRKLVRSAALSDDV